MKLTFIETPVFTELITDLLEDEDYQRMQEYLLIYPTAAMDKNLFEKLIESASQAAEIARGKRNPSRTFEVTSDIVREIRESTSLSQEKFAGLFHISVGTLRNWEQGRRRPDGPAAALLIAIKNDPEHVVAALNSAA